MGISLAKSSRARRAQPDTKPIESKAAPCERSLPRTASQIRAMSAIADGCGSALPETSLPLSPLIKAVTLIMTAKQHKQTNDTINAVTSSQSPDAASNHPSPSHTENKNRMILLQNLMHITNESQSGRKSDIATTAVELVGSVGLAAVVGAGIIAAGPAVAAGAAIGVAAAVAGHAASAKHEHDHGSVEAPLVPEMNNSTFHAIGRKLNRYNPVGMIKKAGNRRLALANLHLEYIKKASLGTVGNSAQNLTNMIEGENLNLSMDLVNNKGLNNAMSKLKTADKIARKTSTKPMNYSNLTVTGDNETHKHFALNDPEIKGDERKVALGLTLRNICDSAILCSDAFSDDTELNKLLKKIDEQEVTEYSVTLNLKTKNNNSSNEAIQLSKQEYKDLVKALYISNYLSDPRISKKDVIKQKNKIAELFVSGPSTVAAVKHRSKEALSSSRISVDQQIQMLREEQSMKKKIV